MLPVETKHLILRKFSANDLATFVRYRNNPEVAKYQSWSQYSSQDADEFFEQQKGLAFDTDDSWFQIALEDGTSGSLVGDVAVHFYDAGRQAELGFTIAPKHQNRGLAKEAVSSVIVGLFTELGKHRLTATIDVRNVAAQRLLEALGFRRESHLVQNIFFKGEWSDEYGYALLASEFEPDR